MNVKSLGKVKRKGLSPQFAIVFVLLALIVLWSALSPAFLTTNNLLLIIKQVTLYGILAVGMTLVIITGGIDLSVGSVVALSAVFAAHFSSGEYAEAPLILPIAVAVGVGTLCDQWNRDCIRGDSEFYYDDVHDAGSAWCSVHLHQCKGYFWVE